MKRFTISLLTMIFLLVFYGSWNTAEDPFGRICAHNEIEDVDLKVFNTIKEMNESKALAK